nr:hypothetical protein 3 [Flavobacteriaceae bacterium]
MTRYERVMYVARDLTYWITDEPHMWAEHVMIEGKVFVPLRPEIIQWFKEHIAHAEASYARGEIPLETIERIINAFCPVYEHAIAVGMVPDPSRRRADDPTSSTTCDREEDLAQRTPANTR